MTNTFFILLLLVLLVSWWFSRNHLESLLKKILKINPCLFIGGVFFFLCLVSFFVCLGPILNSILCCRQEKKAVDARYIDFYENIDNGEFNTAYSYMSPQYRQSHTVAEFRGNFDFLCDPGCWELHPTRSLIISDDKAYLYPGRFILFNKGGPEFELVKIDGEWYFTGRYEWYIDGFTTRNDSDWRH